VSIVDTHTQQPGLEDSRDEEEDVDKNTREDEAEGEIPSGDKDKNKDESKDWDEMILSMLGYVAPLS